MSTRYVESLETLLAAEQKRRKRSEAMGKLLERLLVAAMVMPLRALVLMQAVAVAHDHWLPKLPTIGFWWAFLLAAMLACLSTTSSTKDKR